MITAIYKPVFGAEVKPLGTVSVPVCSKYAWDTLNIAIEADDPETLRKAAQMIYDKLPECMPVSALKAFLLNYHAQIEEYCEKHIDIYGIPERPDFENDTEPLKLPIITFGESLVHEHAGLSFDRIAALDILDYRMLLADAMKIRILRRSDGSGREYLNECYDYMHKISSMFL